MLPLTTTMPTPMVTPTVCRAPGQGSGRVQGTFTEPWLGRGIDWSECWGSSSRQGRSQLFSFFKKIWKSEEAKEDPAASSFSMLDEGALWSWLENLPKDSKHIFLGPPGLGSRTSPILNIFKWLWSEEHLTVHMCWISYLFSLELSLETDYGCTSYYSDPSANLALCWNCLLEAMRLHHTVFQSVWPEWLISADQLEVILPRLHYSFIYLFVQLAISGRRGSLT